MVLGHGLMTFLQVEKATGNRQTRIVTLTCSG
jgi:hypothetical protein